MKLGGLTDVEAKIKVAPRRGAWIETKGWERNDAVEYGRAPQGRVD